MEDLFELASWKSQDPDVPDGDWYKDFGTFKLCGTGRFQALFLCLASRPEAGGCKAAPVPRWPQALSPTRN